MSESIVDALNKNKDKNTSKEGKEITKPEVKAAPQKEVVKEPIKKLTEKEKRFCEEYVFDWNASRAAREAGYSENTAKEIGSQNLTKLHIQAYIEEIQKDLEKLTGISKTKVLNELRKIAFSSIAHLHNTWIDKKDFETLTQDQKDSIAEIETRTSTKNQGTKNDPDYITIEQVKVKLHDKHKAMESISKMLGYNEAEKIEGSLKVTKELDEDERQSLIDEITARATKKPE